MNNKVLAKLPNNVRSPVVKLSMNRRFKKHYTREDARALLPMLREKLATQLMEPVVSSPDELRARMDGEIERWAPVIEAANVTLN